MVESLNASFRLQYTSLSVHRHIIRAVADTITLHGATQ